MRKSDTLINVVAFDMDDTLFKGSCDFAWENYLVYKGFIESQKVNKLRKYFIKRYRSDSFCPVERQECFLSLLSPYPLTTLAELLSKFINEKLYSFVYGSARALVRHHQEKQEKVLIISAASTFIVTAIAKALGIKHTIATDPEIVNGYFTGKIIGTPCFNHHKVLKFKRWMKQNQYHVEKSYFYTDSIHDLPLLREVTCPIAVNPDARLKQEAKKCGWTILYFNDDIN